MAPTEVLFDSFIVLSSLSILFATGWWFLNSNLYKDYEEKILAVDILFCCVFALSCNLLELVVFEIVPVLEKPLVDNCLDIKTPYF